MRLIHFVGPFTEEILKFLITFILFSLDDFDEPMVDWFMVLLQP